MTSLINIVQLKLKFLLILVNSKHLIIHTSSGSALILLGRTYFGICLSDKIKAQVYFCVKGIKDGRFGNICNINSDKHRGDLTALYHVIHFSELKPSVSFISMFMILLQVFADPR